MELPGSDKLKTMWELWDIRVFMLVSLSLQVVLTLLTPWRKRTGNVVVISMIWSVYLLADWVAAATVGKISTKQINRCQPSENSVIATLWAPFLLLHLGGPDTISSFSLQDNELWPRHLCGLVLQDGAALYVFLKSLPGDKLLSLSTMLVLIAGTIRYAERIQALYAASSGGFGDSVFRKPDPGPKYEKVVEIYNSLKLSGLPTQFVTIQRRESSYLPRAPNEQAAPIHEKSQRAVLETGYQFFETFKGLIVSYVFTAKERQQSRNFFLYQEARHAFRLVEVELSFLYEVLHTKTFVLRHKWGWIWRLISYCSILSAFASFYAVGKDGFRKSDVIITYLLFSAAVSLDVISLFTLLLSDRTAIAIKKKWYDPILRMMSNRKRWSGKVSQCNLLEFCLHKESETLNTIAELVRMRGRLDKIRLSFWLRNPKVDNHLEEFIFKELRRRSLVAKDVATASKISSHRGNWALSDAGIDLNSELYSSIVEVPYAQSVLLWHIATTLLWCEDERKKGGEEKREVEGSPYREICKTLSDYVFYLLVLQPNMMSALSSNWQLMLQDTCAEAKRFWKNLDERRADLETTCGKILEVDTPVKPVYVKGYASKSVLFVACGLARCLRDELDSSKWKIMGGVWVELLSYAANNCKVDVNAERPSKGGELLTIVWFLLNHLGLGKQFDADDGARVQIVVKK
ncbi:uncharacterized protein LOC115739689 [Rhodamnia argentea]|uniref:Uncharacterized protein LOC115739689 n=1 Tax=Rhodamnia argentea TaxID=178133 RepID=A0A8B8P1Q9_9MYRT|nr:uncharacterized protein LOC115739689 [Rhodamnia argentea]